MSDVHRDNLVAFEVVAGGKDPIGQFLGLRVRTRMYRRARRPARRIGRRVRQPFQVVLARRGTLGRAGALMDEQLPLKGRIAVGLSGHWGLPAEWCRRSARTRVLLAPSQPPVSVVRSSRDELLAAIDVVRR